MVTNVLQEKKGGFSLAKYHVIAYADEDGYSRRETVIEARDTDEALYMAWRMFPEYHEVGVFETK